ncbi:MAG: hypothetical protein IKV48_06435 [Eggerthellaceae bacterium]|nr:hypothetical protein [Eggerthellaceae bacterium]
MVKKTAICAFTAALALSAALAVGCAPAASEEAVDEGAYVSDGLPGLMPEDHEGRFETMGAEMCFTCHGANESAYPILDTAQPLPADHFAGGQIESYELDNARAECITCHSQG